MMKRLASMRLGFVSFSLYMVRGRGAGKHVRPHVSLGCVPTQILGVQHLDQVEQPHAARRDRDTADSKDDNGADLLRLAHPQMQHHRNGQHKQHDVRNDVQTRSRHVQARRVQAVAVDLWHVGLVHGGAVEVGHQGDDGRGDADDGDGGPDGDLPAALGRQLQVEGEEGQLGEAVAHLEDAGRGVGYGAGVGPFSHDDLPHVQSERLAGDLCCWM